MNDHWRWNSNHDSVTGQDKLLRKAGINGDIVFVTFMDYCSTTNLTFDNGAQRNYQSELMQLLAE